MKKFIKVNLIILVIFCLLFNLRINIYATSDDSEEFQENQELLQKFEVLDSEEEFENNFEQSDQDVEDLEQQEFGGIENLEEIVGEEQSEEEKNLDDLQIEKSNLESDIESSNTQIQFIESELTATVAEIAEINQQIIDKEIEIQTLAAQEDDLLKYIAKAEYELEESNKRYEKQKELLETRLVAMYETGDMSYLDLLFNSKSISEFLSNYFLIEEIAKADTELLETVEAERIYNKKLKETLDTKKLILIASRETREKNAIALENMGIIKNSRLKKLTEEELLLHQKIEEYQNQIAEIETEIRLLALANVGEEYVGGAMAWPVPGYTRITSRFGMRTHPITGVFKLHTGVDVGAPRGAQFIAANDGIVTYAGWNTAYGNMVIIDHGGGITTLYAHGDEILVSVGETIYQGHPVLKVGSTGYSTGPHAHFEVRINGEYVEPLDYITSYSSEVKAQKNENVIVETKDEVKVEVDTNENINDDESQEILREELQDE
ncbi:MAG: peptidoglycan DD-metalloendopeptidase family protein [Clostridia bacterium]|nr:peptidoglycan DD-metalloendopeptidase family protein [Clostridia bacterium]